MGEPTGNALIDQILQHTKVDVNPKKPEPGDQMTVETIPGFLPLIYPDLSAHFVDPVLGVEVPVIVDTLVKPVKFSVHYKVVLGDKVLLDTEVDMSTITSLSPLELPDSAPLMGLIRLPPPLVAEHEAKPTENAEFIASFNVEVEGSAPLDPRPEVHIPLELVAIPIPTLLILKSDPDDEDYPSSKIFVMTRLGSALSSASDAVSILNSAVQVLNEVKDIPGGAGFDLLLGNLSKAVDMIKSPGFTIAGFAVEEAPNFDDMDDFDDEARSSLMIGPVGTRVWLYNSFEFNNSEEAGEDESSVFEITEDLGNSLDPPIPLGFGVHEITDLKSKNWDTDPGDDPMDDIESCNFGESKWEDQP